MAENPAFEKIGQQVRDNDVVLYMKGSGAFPVCGFSAFAAQVLQHFAIDFLDVNVLEDQEIWDGVKQFSNWPTIPQLYIKGEFVGGADILREMVENGEFQPLLKEKGVKFKEIAA